MSVATRFLEAVRGHKRAGRLTGNKRNKEIPGMSGTTLPYAIPLQVAQNPAWKPGTCSFTLSITNDQQEAPTVTSDNTAVATVTLGTEGGGVLNPSYEGTIAAVAVGTANISYALPGAAPVLFATITVTEDAEGVTVTTGTPTPPSAS